MFVITQNSNKEIHPLECVDSPPSEVILLLAWNICTFALFQNTSRWRQQIFHGWLDQFAVP